MLQSLHLPPTRKGERLIVTFVDSRRSKKSAHGHQNVLIGAVTDHRQRYLVDDLLRDSVIVMKIPTWKMLRRCLLVHVPWP